jgi:hypothetical protein
METLKTALKIIFLFKKPDWDDFRTPYIVAGVVAWLDVTIFLFLIIC